MMPLFFSELAFKVIRLSRLASLDKSKRRDAFKTTPTAFLEGCCCLELRVDEVSQSGLIETTAFTFISQKH